MSMRGNIIDLRLRFASWIVGKHSLGKNLQFGFQGRLFVGMGEDPSTISLLDGCQWAGTGVDDRLTFVFGESISNFPKFLAELKKKNENSFPFCN